MNGGQLIPVHQVVAAFQNDHKVLELNTPWPDSVVEQLNLLRKAARPADYILHLTWQECFLSQPEFLDHVRPVWPQLENEANHSWTMRGMLTALKDGSFQARDMARIQKLKVEIEHHGYLDLPLLGYNFGNGRILLEDGHHRVAAAWLANALPPTLRMYIGTLQ